MSAQASRTRAKFDYKQVTQKENARGERAFSGRLSQLGVLGVLIIHVATLGG
jgi:hypothetical protein